MLTVGRAITELLNRSRAVSIDQIQIRRFRLPRLDQAKGGGAARGEAEDAAEHHFFGLIETEHRD